MTPVEAACAGAEFEAANKIVPISRKIDAETIVIFFKNYTRILVLLEKAVGLRFAIVPVLYTLKSYVGIFPKFSRMRSR